MRKNRTAIALRLAIAAQLAIAACGNSDPTSDAGPGADAGTADAMTADATTADASVILDANVDDDASENGGQEVRQICAGEEEVSFHPVAGSSTVIVSSSVKNPFNEFELVGPERLHAEAAGHGCLFLAMPGTYEVTLLDGETRISAGTIELADKRTSLLALYDAAPGPDALVVPLDLTTPKGGQWRVIVVNLALDVPETPLDVYAYAPGVERPQEGSAAPTQIVNDLAFGESIAVNVAPDTLTFEHQPDGIALDPTFVFRGLPCAASAVVNVHVVWCDTNTVDEGESCAGGALFVFSVEDETC